jgi:hypothetical protein
MKNILLLLILLTGCSKEPLPERMAQLSTESIGTYYITYGTNNSLTVKEEGKWSTTLGVKPGDTIHLSATSEQLPVTLYLSVEIQEGFIYCKSMYIEPQSTGSLNHVVN